jgi:Tol biopolymer transport system component
MKKASVLLAASAAALVLTAAGCGDSKSGSNANPTLEQAVKYAQCMRENGVTNWPDPDRDGRFVIAAGGPNQSSPQFKKAQQACKSQQPPGMAENPAQVAHEQNEWLKVARCMRKNGVPNFPDPQNGRLRVPRDRIDVKSPQFKRAQQACRDAGHPGGGSENGRG